MKLVKFMRGHAPYNAGEVAGFSDEFSQRLVDAGVAAPHPPQTEQAETEADEAKAPDRPPADKMVRGGWGKGRR